MGWHKGCCCKGVAETTEVLCCPGVEIPNRLYATFSSACGTFDGIVIPLNWNSVSNKWEGSFGATTIDGGTVSGDFTMACGTTYFGASVWNFTGTLIWSQIFPDAPDCEWWTDATEGGDCPSDLVHVRPGGWDGTSCYGSGFQPTYCGTCPDGMKDNGGTGSFYNTCVPCFMDMSATFSGSHSSASCDPFSVTKVSGVGVGGGGCPDYTYPCTTGTLITLTVTA